MDAHTSWFLDYIPNERIRPFMAISDVVVYPYHMISQSAAIQMAYAFGKPVVATLVGGLSDVVDGQNGLLVLPHDPTALAEAITKILCDPVLKQRMSEHSKMLAETRGAWLPRR
jgi:glycosyltransferase involved in cell wall biosynthesis